MRRPVNRTPHSSFPAQRSCSALQEGGYVIYFRHADTGPASPEPAPVDLQRCETQRNLNEHGRNQARQIGEQFRRLRIPVGEVLTSEFCRCWQTAELAFGRYRKVNALTGVSRDPASAEQRVQSATALRGLLAVTTAALPLTPSWYRMATTCSTRGVSAGHTGRGGDLLTRWAWKLPLACSSRTRRLGTPAARLRNEQELPISIVRGSSPRARQPLPILLVLSHTETLRIEISGAAMLARTEVFRSALSMFMMSVLAHLKTMLKRRPHRTPLSIRLETLPI